MRCPGVAHGVELFHNVWRAPDGRVAAVLVNWTRDPQPWKLESQGVSGAGVLVPRSWHVQWHHPAPKLHASDILRQFWYNVDQSYRSLDAKAGTPMTMGRRRDTKH